MAKKLKELDNIDKPREKLIKKGTKALKDYELMAILLGSGVRGKDVLKLSKEIVNLLQDDFNSLSLEKLLSIHGLGIAKASQILSAIELSKRYLIKQNKKITSPHDIYDELIEYQNKKQEYFIAIYLDGANYICSKQIITIGILNQSLVHPREVFAPAIENRCASIIIAHNHPSGELTPSEADIMITQRLKQSGEILGIDIIDHIIISKNGFYSFSENMLI